MFDAFIHVVDTLSFLAPLDVLRRTIETHVVGGLLHADALTLTGDGFSAVGTIHLNSGLNEERLDVIGDGARYTVLNLADRIEARGTQRHYRRGDWVPVGPQRGFEALCEQFLQAARERTLTDRKAILQTHEICEAIVRHAEQGSDTASTVRKGGEEQLKTI